MRCELLHTSLPRGLDGGTGFVVAARTGGMPRTLSDALADLSGLSEAWPGASDWDRTLRATRAIEWRGEQAWVASVIRPCGLDHTGRGNRIAHHRLIDSEARRRCDPVSLLLDHERWMARWQGEPRELDQEAPLPELPGHAGPALAWKAAFGDAGVAAEMIERAYRSGVGAWIVVPAGFDRLQLLHELAGLLPAENRWKRGWSTRPLRPVADPAPVIAVVDEREPLVCAAPSNAAWVLVPRAGDPPTASEGMLRRARQGAADRASAGAVTGGAQVAWQPPSRLAFPGAATPQATTPAAASPQQAAIRSEPATIRVELEPAAGGRARWWLVGIGAAVLAVAALLWRTLA